MRPANNNQTRAELFESNSFNRAFANASAAINAIISIYLSFRIFHGNSFNRAAAYARFATCAFFSVNFCSHDSLLL